MWPCPPVRAAYRADPSALASHLLGHEGEGSALAALQDFGWATALSAGLRVDDRRFALFQIKVTLTPTGEENWRGVVSVVEAHCELLRTMSDAELQRHWAECVAMRRLGFNFLEKAAPYDWAASHAGRLMHFSPRHVLSAGHLLDASLEPAAARAWIGMLHRGNMIVLITCQSAPTTLRAEHVTRTPGGGGTQLVPGMRCRPVQRALRQRRLHQAAGW
jgi:insulysin